MTDSARPIIASTAGIAALWVVAVIALGFGGEALFGYWLSERLSPFSNVHLVEEAAEGLYSPLTDPVFLIHTVAIAVVVFGGPTFLLARQGFRQHPSRAGIPSVLVICAIAVLWKYVWSEGYPAAMRWGYLFALGSYAMATASALFIAAKRGADV